MVIRFSPIQNTMRLLTVLSLLTALPALAEDWPQYQFNARHSGNAPDRELAAEQLGLLAAVPLTDGLYTSPVVADGRVYVVDGSGVCACFDAGTLKELW